MNKKEQFQPSHTHAGFSLPLRVYNQDIDAGRVVFVANYLKFMERARTEWLFSIGVDQRYMARELRTTFVLRDVEIQCLKPAQLDDMLNVTVRLEGLGGSTVRMYQTVMRDDLLLCKANITAVCVHVVKFRAVPIPPEIRRRFQLDLDGAFTPKSTEETRLAVAV